MKQILFAVLLILISCGDKKLTKEMRIYDEANLLTDAQEDSIFTLIQKLDNDIGSQIAVVTIDTLIGTSINDYSWKKVEQLQLGRKEEKDGLLITLAVKNREMRIEVGYGLERIIKDEIAARINREVMAPYFRKGKFGLGVYKGIDSIRFLIERDRALVGKKPY